MKPRIDWTYVIVVVLALATGLAPVLLEDHDPDLQHQVLQLRQEKDKLASQLEELDRELRQLKASHAYYIGVNCDISDRLARVEGRKTAGGEMNSFFAHETAGGED